MQKRTDLKQLAALAALLACGLAFARELPPKLQIDVDFFDNLETVRPYCGSNWIDRFFADCQAHGVKRVTWRCFAQIANYPTKLNYTMDSVQTIRSAADERRFAGAFAAKVGVGHLPPGKTFGGIRQRIVPKDGGRAGARPSREYLFRGMVSSDALTEGNIMSSLLNKGNSERISPVNDYSISYIHEWNEGFNNSIGLETRRIYSNRYVPMFSPDSTHITSVSASQLHYTARFSWDETGRFKKGQYILMHSVIYRTQVLKDCGLKLPEHCFYVDNIYVFDPMPYVKNIYYADVNFYYYFIGRDDQSVNQEVMIRRLDQQARVNRIMIDYFSDSLRSGLIEKKSRLFKYMYNYLEIITTITSVMAICSGEKDKMDIMDEVWNYLRDKDAQLYRKIRSGVFGIALHLPGKGGKAVVKACYKVAQGIFGFN